MDSYTNLEIKGDRMWASAMEYRKDIHTVSKKMGRDERMNDYDMKVIKYAVILADSELQRRRVRDLEEEAEMRNFGVDNPPAE